jgi:hypothetical protein
MSFQYMKALRSRLGKAQPGAAKGAGRKQVVINLDEENGSEISKPGGAIFTNTFVQEEDLPVGVQMKFNQLTKKWTTCVKCPHPTGCYCVRHANGAHVRVTVKHMLSWAKLWVACFML